MQSEFLFTSESVTEGHPDKLCDQISDAIVGHFLRQDPGARVVAECAISTGIVFLSVKYRASCKIGIADIARSVIRDVGYDEAAFDADRCTVMTSLHEFPEARVERERAVDDLQRSAEEQATLFGFACRQTEPLMPLPIVLAHRLARQLSQVRSSGTLPYLGPDGKTQVGVVFRGRQPYRIHSLTLLASQRSHGAVSEQRLRDELIELVIRPAFAETPIGLDAQTAITINPDGPFIGGPADHAGLTGRKTAVDTYGEFARHSGAALSGKGPSRIDRVGAYAARHAAKNVVAADLAESCEVQLSYSIGRSEPVSVHVETFGTARCDEDEIAARITAALDLRVAAIAQRFRLRELASEHPRGFYRELAAFGHFGRPDLRLPWEQLDAVAALVR
jgi:S-adenosylmethionine synthetase